MASGGKKQNALTVRKKIEILENVDRGGRSKTEICKEFGIPNSTLSTIIKNRIKIQSTYETGDFEGSRKRLRLPKYEDLDAGLLLWFKQARSQNAPISGPLLMEKADKIAIEMGITFKSNPGWLERFKTRHGIVFKCISGEARQVSADMTSDWISSTLPTILKDYERKDIFNADEFGLFFRCLPDKTLTFKGETCSGGKKSKERLTVLVGCNSDGTEKLPLFVIGKSQNPRCFKNIKNLPLQYTANKKAWMTADLFSGWLKSLDKTFLKENRKVVLIIDNCPAHPKIQLESVKLIFLPPNTTSVLQPCDQGIINNLKVFYKKKLLQKYLASVELKEDIKQVSVLDALYMLRFAWKLVTPVTIENCFRHSGFSNPTLTDDDQPEIISETNVNDDVHTIFDRISVLTNLPQNIMVEDYLSLDNNIDTTPLLNDREICDLIKSNTIQENEDSGKDDEDDVPAPVPSVETVRKCILDFRRFAEAQPDGEKVYNILGDLENFLEENIINKMVQRKITDFFETAAS